MYKDVPCAPIILELLHVAHEKYESIARAVVCGNLSNQNIQCIKTRSVQCHEEAMFHVYQIVLGWGLLYVAHGEYESSTRHGGVR